MSDERSLFWAVAGGTGTTDISLTRFCDAYSGMPAVDRCAGKRKPLYVNLLSIVLMGTTDCTIDARGAQGQLTNISNRCFISPEHAWSSSPPVGHIHICPVSSADGTTGLTGMKCWNHAGAEGRSNGIRAFGNRGNDTLSFRTYVSIPTDKMSAFRGE